MNLLRFSIPLFIVGTAGFQLIDGETPLSMFLAVDILQLAGLAFIAGISLVVISILTFDLLPVGDYPRSGAAIYFIQWVLFGWSILIFDAHKQNAYVAALIGLVVLIFTHLLIKTKFIKKVFSWI